MSEPGRGVTGQLAVLAGIFLPPVLALAFFGSLWARAGAVAGALAGLWMAGRRDPPPYGRLLYGGPARPLHSEAERAYVERLHRQRRRLPAIGIVVVIAIVLCAVAGILAGHPRYAPFTGGETAPGSPGWTLHQAGLALVTAWLGLLAGVASGWLGIVLAARRSSASPPGTPPRA